MVTLRWLKALFTLGATRNRRAWLTRDAVPATEQKTITLPSDAAWQGDFFGAVLALTRAENWQKWGDLQPEEMASAWLEIVLDWMGVEE